MSRKKAPSTSSPKAPAPLEELVIGGETYVTRLTGKFRNRDSWERPDRRRVESVIPGTIQKILVKEGQEVVHGTPLLILEAMKMRNEVLAPVDGVIFKIHVSEGVHVPKSQLLMELR
jgi:biotin carboxyl carrier protein